MRDLSIVGRILKVECWRRTCLEVERCYSERRTSRWIDAGAGTLEMSNALSARIAESTPKYPQLLTADDETSRIQI